MSSLLTITRHDKEFHQFQLYITSVITTLCKGSILKTYMVAESLPKADIIIVMFNTGKTRRGIRREIKGFAVLRKKTNHLYLDTICASGVGGKILSEAVTVAQSYGYATIRIASLPIAMPYWLKQGFVNAAHQPKWDADLLADAKKVSELKGFKSDDDALKNKTMYSYLAKLRKHKLTSDKSCKTVSNCAKDGFVMVLDVNRFGQVPAIKKAIDVKQTRSTTKRRSPPSRRPSTRQSSRQLSQQPSTRSTTKRRPSIRRPPPSRRSIRRPPPPRK